MTTLRWPLLLAEHDAAIEADCVPIVGRYCNACQMYATSGCRHPLGPQYCPHRGRADALDDARAALWRALEADGSLSRCSYLYKARDALHAAGQRAWADVAEAAAGRIGGDGREVQRLLFEVDAEISRQEHSI